MKTERKSNIELLRLICMFMIVIHHFLVHGGLWMLPASINKDIVNFFVPFGKICFDSFLAISCWFLAKSNFRGTRFVKTWFQVLTFNVVFTIAAMLLGSDGIAIGKRVILGSFFPMIGNSHGFAAAYLIFYLSLPLLKKIQSGLTQRQTQYVLLILGMTQVLTPFVGMLIGYTQPQQSEFVLFIFVYFLAVYLQNWPVKTLESVPFLVVTAIVLFVVIIGNNMVAEYRNNLIIEAIRAVTSSEFGVLNIAAGFLLFLLFYRIELPNNRLINFFATTTFGVLLFHDHNYFRTVLWQGFKELFDWGTLNPIVFLGMIFVISTCVFILGMVIDLLRQHMFEKPLMNTQFVRKITSSIEFFTDMSQNTEISADK